MRLILKRFLFSDGLPPKDGEFAQFSDLWYPIPMAVMMMVLRWIVEKYIFRPIGLRVGMRDSRRSYPKSNPVLEASFRKSPHPSHDVVKSLSEDTKLTVMEVRFVDRCHIWMDGTAWTYDTITVSLTPGAAMVPPAEAGRAAVHAAEVLRDGLEVRLLHLHLRVRPPRAVVQTLVLGHQRMLGGLSETQGEVFFF